MILKSDCIKRLFTFCPYNQTIIRMTSLSSSCEPTPQKRSRIEDKVIENDSNEWRSKLTRVFDEIDVGITEFIGKHKPFEGILKNRYEDFVVHEISKCGETVRLTDVKVPEDEVIPVVDIYEVLSDDTIEEIRELCDENNGEEVVNDDNTTIKEKESQTNSDKCVKILVNGMNKFERTRIHKAIGDHFSELETSTVDQNNNKYIIVKKEDKNSRQRKREIWPKSKGEYIHFVLYKENKETQQAINELALKMHISSKNLSYAGTKDKRAITTQTVCAWKVPPKRIWSAAERIQFIRVGNFRFQKESINLGDLKGNHFDIILRDIKCSDREDAESALNSVKNIGFINYYGMQRFGFQHEKPYNIGILIVQKKWKEVVESILSPKAQDMKSNYPNSMTFNESIELWRTTRNASLVYKQFPFKYTPEGTLLKGLTKVNANDFHGALCAGMHRNSRLLYIHCYQSYIWNKVASYRLKTYGLKVVEGDLLSINSNNKDIEIKTDSKSNNSNIVFADENNIKDASIYDIVIPVIGSENLLPKNSTLDFIKSLLAEDEITLDLFNDIPKQWCVFGSYRKLFIKPENFDWNWIPYNDPNISLIETDIQLINKSESTDAMLKSEEQDVSVDEKMALKLSMCLPSSCYATMMCREITKTESTHLEYKSWLKNKYNL